MKTSATCQHFDGRTETCALAIDIRAHVGGETSGWKKRRPCVQRPWMSSDVVACGRFVSREDAAEDDKIADALGENVRPRGLAALLGTWPGDETDEEIAAALERLRGSEQGGNGDDAVREQDDGLGGEEPG